jgi:hypothetical protein
MSPLFVPDPDAVQAVRDEAERRLSPEEFQALIDAPMSDEEREETLSLIDWFMRRYPTPAARLAYARKRELALRRQGLAPPRRRDE